jgi:hypothetical protein
LKQLFDAKAPVVQNSTEMRNIAQKILQLFVAVGTGSKGVTGD